MPTNEFKDKAKQLVLEGKLDEVSRLLLDKVKKDSDKNSIIVQSGRYHDLQLRMTDGTISPEVYQREINQLRLNILNIIDVIDVDKPNPLNTNKESYKISLARIEVLRLLMAHPDGLTIKELHDGSGLKNRKYIIFTLDELIAEKLVERFTLEKESRNKLSTKGRKFVNTLQQVYLKRLQGGLLNF